jgi:hypothetical protein
MEHDPDLDRNLLNDRIPTEIVSIRNTTNTPLGFVLKQNVRQKRYLYIASIFFRLLGAIFWLIFWSLLSPLHPSFTSVCYVLHRPPSVQLDCPATKEYLILMTLNR